MLESQTRVCNPLLDFSSVAQLTILNRNTGRVERFIRPITQGEPSNFTLSLCSQYLHHLGCPGLAAQIFTRSPLWAPLSRLVSPSSGGVMVSGWAMFVRDRDDATRGVKDKKTHHEYQ